MYVFFQTSNNKGRVCCGKRRLSNRSTTMGDDLDHLLTEIEQLFQDPQTISKENISLPDGKCILPFLGPIASKSIHKPCSALRCIQCDFAVLELPDAKWRPGTDYMFLRTNMPYAWKLAKQLEKCPGSFAYACQCSHIATTELKPLTDFPSIQWACRGHNRQK